MAMASIPSGIHNDYIKKTVGPVLTRCLREVTEIRPQDPIDFIAKWLYRESDNSIFYRKKTEDNVVFEQKRVEMQAAQEKRKINVKKLKETMKDTKNEAATLEKEIEEAMWRRRQILEEAAAALAAKRNAQLKAAAREAAEKDLQARKLQALLRARDSQTARISSSSSSSSSSSGEWRPTGKKRRGQPSISSSSSTPTSSTSTAVQSSSTETEEEEESTQVENDGEEGEKVYGEEEKDGERRKRRKSETRENIQKLKAMKKAMEAGIAIDRSKLAALRSLMESAIRKDKPKSRRIARSFLSHFSDTSRGTRRTSTITTEATETSLEGSHISRTPSVRVFDKKSRHELKIKHTQLDIHGTKSKGEFKGETKSKGELTATERTPELQKSPKKLKKGKQEYDHSRGAIHVEVHEERTSLTREGSFVSEPHSERSSVAQRRSFKSMDYADPYDLFRADDSYRSLLDDGEDFADDEGPSFKPLFKAASHASKIVRRKPQKHAGPTQEGSLQTASSAHSQAEVASHVVPTQSPSHDVETVEDTSQTRLTDEMPSGEALETLRKPTKKTKKRHQGTADHEGESRLLDAEKQEHRESDISVSDIEKLLSDMEEEDMGEEGKRRTKTKRKPRVKPKERPASGLRTTETTETTETTGAEDEDLGREVEVEIEVEEKTSKKPKRRPRIKSVGRYSQRVRSIENLRRGSSSQLARLKGRHKDERKRHAERERSRAKQREYKQKEDERDYSGEFSDAEDVEVWEEEGSEQDVKGEGYRRIIRDRDVVGTDRESADGVISTRIQKFLSSKTKQSKSAHLQESELEERRREKEERLERTASDRLEKPMKSREKIGRGSIDSARSFSDPNQEVMRQREKIDKKQRQLLIPQKVTWRGNWKQQLVCEHPALGDIAPRPPLVPTENADWWKRQKFIPEVLFDNEIYTRDNNDVVSGYNPKKPGLSLKDFVRPGPWMTASKGKLSGVDANQCTSDLNKFQLIKAQKSSNQFDGESTVVLSFKAGWPPVGRKARAAEKSGQQSLDSRQSSFVFAQSLEQKAQEVAAAEEAEAAKRKKLASMGNTKHQDKSSKHPHHHSKTGSKSGDTKTHNMNNSREPALGGPNNNSASLSQSLVPVTSNPSFTRSAGKDHWQVGKLDRVGSAVGCADKQQKEPLDTMRGPDSQTSSLDAAEIHVASQKITSEARGVQIRGTAPDRGGKSETSTEGKKTIGTKHSITDKTQNATSKNPIPVEEKAAIRQEASSVKSPLTHKPRASASHQTQLAMPITVKKAEIGKREVETCSKGKENVKVDVRKDKPTIKTEPQTRKLERSVSSQVETHSKVEKATDKSILAEARRKDSVPGQSQIKSTKRSGSIKRFSGRESNLPDDVRESQTDSTNVASPTQGNSVSNVSVSRQPDHLQSDEIAKDQTPDSPNIESNILSDVVGILGNRSCPWWERTRRNSIQKPNVSDPSTVSNRADGSSEKKKDEPSKKNREVKATLGTDRKNSSSMSEESHRQTCLEQGTSPQARGTDCKEELDATHSDASCISLLDRTFLQALEYEASNEDTDETEEETNKTR